MPKSRKTFAKFICITFLSSCGPAANDSFRMSASSAFDDALSSLKLEKSCEKQEDYGCATLLTSGTSVKGAFEYSQLYTQCSVTENGFSIAFTNTIETIPTFQGRVNIYKVDAPEGDYACIGPEFTQTTPSYIYKEGFCEARFLVHGTPFSATEDEICEVSFTGESPVRGVVACEGLTADRFYLSIQNTSTFECQP